MSLPPVHVFPHEAMATGFAIRIALDDREYARQAARAAFETCDRMERLLSRYDETSEVSEVNRLADGGTCLLGPDTFACLALAEELQRATGGAFDPGLGAWTAAARPGAAPPPPRGQLVLDPERRLVQRRGGPVGLDLGAIGKGYALDRMADELREWEIDAALLVAGGSSIVALGSPAPGLFGWEIGVGLDGASVPFLLRDGSIGSSGAAVKGAHIVDPATGQARMCHARTWAVSSRAAVSDALSTAWMNLDLPEIEEVCRRFPDAGALIGREGEGIVEIALPACLKRSE